MDIYSIILYIKYVKMQLQLKIKINRIITKIKKRSRFI